MLWQLTKERNHVWSSPLKRYCDDRDVGLEAQLLQQLGHQQEQHQGLQHVMLNLQTSTGVSIDALNQLHTIKAVSVSNLHGGATMAEEPGSVLARRWRLTALSSV